MGYTSDIEDSEFDSDFPFGDIEDSEFVCEEAEVSEDLEDADVAEDKFDIDVKQVKHYTIADVLTTEKAVKSCKFPKRCKLKPRHKEGPRLKKTDHRAVVY